MLNKFHLEDIAQTNIHDLFFRENQSISEDLAGWRIILVSDLHTLDMNTKCVIILTLK